MASLSNQHIPVLRDEVVGYLQPEPGETILDCTINGAGHAEAVLDTLMPNGFLIGIDKDAQALESARSRLSKFKDRFVLVKENFKNLDAVLENLRIDMVDGMLFDLGLSSLQLGDEKRGFSIRVGGRLDMRMDLDSRLDAYELVNKSPQDELDWMLRNYGEERWHKRIARATVERRRTKPIERTNELADIVRYAVPGSGRSRIHPATRTFQALRIAVNEELSALGDAMDKAVNFLKPGARVCVISYHSLEDRIVKEKFKSHSNEKRLRILTKKPIRPGAEEIMKNPRSRSAKLRAAEGVPLAGAEGVPLAGAERP